MTSDSGEHLIRVPFHVPLVAPDPDYVDKVDSIRDVWWAALATGAG